MKLKEFIMTKRYIIVQCIIQDVLPTIFCKLHPEYHNRYFTKKDDDIFKELLDIMKGHGYEPQEFERWFNDNYVMFANKWEIGGKLGIDPTNYSFKKLKDMYYDKVLRNQT